jgi:hypothetical protein
MACYLGVTILVLFNMNNIYFWDTIQFGSKHAHWYYEQNFQYLLLPDSIDSGHPPGFGMYIALMWKIFGKKLIISHLSMLPFIYVSIHYAYKIGSELTNKKFGVFFPIILLLNTIYLGHSILVSPDIMLVAFFLGLWYASLKRNNYLKSVLILLLACISLRGMMLAFAFYIYELYLLNKAGQLSFNYSFKTIRPYLPGGFLGGLYLLFHFYSKSWLVYHESSPWAGSFEIIGITGMLKNILVLVWRFLDFGFIFICLGTAYMLVNKSITLSKKSLDLLALIAILFIFTGIPLIFYQALTGHRYLLPIYILLSFIFLLFFKDAILIKWKKNVLLMFVLTGMFSGNFWVYPDSIAQGWDVTLAHTPYYQLRENVIEFLNEEGIDIRQVGTKFPAKTPNKYLYLNEDLSGFKEADLKTDRYILYSNIFNDFSDEEYLDLQTNWSPIFKKEVRFVHFYLYKRI